MEEVGHSPDAAGELVWVGDHPPRHGVAVRQLPEVVDGEEVVADLVQPEPEQLYVPLGPPVIIIVVIIIMIMIIIIILLEEN